VSSIVVSPIDPCWGSPEDRQLHVVLVHPEIPPNTGSVARLCAATGATLHLVEPLGFDLDDRHLRRAGLDYWPNVTLVRHPSFAAIQNIFPRERIYVYSSRAQTRYCDTQYQPGDVLVFGAETTGVPQEIRTELADQLRWLPIRRTGVRSINLANAVAAVLYEALRQTSFHLIQGENFPGPV